MSNWRAMAEAALKGGNTRNDRHARGGVEAFVPTVPSVPPLDPAHLLKSWWSSLSALDPCQPRPGFTMGRWQTLYDASVWFLDKHARQAARGGWSTGDIFGIEPRMERWGGLIDRLGDCRGLLMDADRAIWSSSFYGARTFGRGCGAGLHPFWSVELSGGGSRHLPRCS